MSNWEEQYMTGTSNDAHAIVTNCPSLQYASHYVKWLEQTADRLREENAELKKVIDVYAKQDRDADKAEAERDGLIDAIDEMLCCNDVCSYCANIGKSAINRIRGEK